MKLNPVLKEQKSRMPPQTQRLAIVKLTLIYHPKLSRNPRFTNAQSRPTGCRLEQSCQEATPNYLPVHEGLRFSLKALSPSLASSVMASKAIWLSV